MKKLLATAALLALTAGMAQAQPMPPADAQAAPAMQAPVMDNTPSPTGTAQIEQRLQDQKARIDAAQQSGQISPEQAMHDKKHLHHVAHKLHRAQAKNGGVITKGEQGKMNEKLNHNAHHLHHQIKKDAETGGAPVMTPAPAVAQ